MDENGVVKGLSAGETVIFAITADGGKTARCDVSVLEALSGHGYVDLGLSVRWAACNVGADSPEEYDAARAIWGAPWQLPTKAQVVELLETCEWKWTEMNGCRGYKVTGPNGNSIFLPAAGWIQGSSLLEVALIGPVNDRIVIFSMESVCLLTAKITTSLIFGSIGSVVSPSDPSSDLPSDFETVGQAILDLPTVEITGI